MKETGNGYIDILNMPTDLRMDLINRILELKEIKKEKVDEMRNQMSMKN